MVRSLLLQATARARTAGALDTALRYHPWLRARVEDRLRRFDSDACIDRMLSAAQRTRYGCGRVIHFSQWPVLEKEALREKPQDFVNPRHPLRVPAGTGGTTGIPLKLWRSLESIVAEQAFIDGLLAPHALSLRSRVAVLRAENVKASDNHAPPYGRLSHGGQRLTLSSLHLNLETLSWFHEALADFAPEVLWVYPSAAINLMTLLARAHRTLKIPVLLASSEELSTATHRALEDFFQGKVINYYGQAERVCFACSTRPGEFYFDPRYGRVELETAAAEGAAKIIGTSYWNRAMPLIRYDTGDLLYVSASGSNEELAEIAAGKRPFSALAGRSGEYLLARGGLRIIGINSIPRESNHVLQMQLVQTDADHVRIHVLAAPGFSAADAKDIEARARAKIPSSIHIAVQAADRLITTARGKTPLVVRMFSEDGQ